MAKIDTKFRCSCLVGWVVSAVTVLMAWRGFGAELLADGTVGYLMVSAEQPGVVTLRWPQVVGADGYKVERRGEDGEFVLLMELAAIGGEPQFIDSDVEPDRAFIYRVTAGETVFGPVSVATAPPYLVDEYAASAEGGADAMIARVQPGYAFGSSETAAMASFFLHDEDYTWSEYAQASKVYLRFKLGDLSAVTGARLKMTATGVGRFAETGYFNTQVSLLADAPPNWSEISLTWNSAPQNSTTAPGFTGSASVLGYLYSERNPGVGEEYQAQLNFGKLLQGVSGGEVVTLALNQYDGATVEWATRENQLYAAPVLEISSVNPASRRPGFLAAAPEFGHSVNLSWLDLADNESGYELERRTNGGAYEPLALLAQDAVSFVDGSAQPDNFYEYRLRAINPVAASGWSRVAEIVTPNPFAGWGTVWDGKSGMLFSTALNWDMGVVPPIDGSVYLNFAQRGNRAYLVERTAVLGLSMHSESAFTIGSQGGRLVVGAGGLRAAAPQPGVPMEYEITADIEVAAAQSWGVTNSGAAVTTLLLSGSITDGGGAYTITKSGSGRVVLAGDNHFGGTVVVADGVLAAHHDRALGTLAGATDVRSGASLEMGGGARSAEAVTVRGGGVLGAGGSHSNYLSGPITLAANAQVAALDAATLVLSGSKSVGGDLTLNAAPDAVVVLTGEPVSAAGRILTASGGGVVALGAPESSWGELKIASTTVRMEATEVLPRNSTLTFGQAEGLDAIFDLNGYDQWVAQVKRGLTTAGRRLITSDKPAILTVDYSGALLTFDASLGGCASLNKLGSGTLWLSAKEHSTSGAFMVGNGVLRFNSATPVLPTNATLSITAPGKVQLHDSVVETVHELHLDGGRKWAGTWGTSGSGADNIDDEHFVGNGVIVVPYGSSSAWDGGAASSRVDEPFNWDYDDLPELFDGSRRLSFGVGGAVATINTNIFLRGIILDRAADFTIAPGGGTIKLGTEALWAANGNGDVAPVYTIGAPLEITGPQTWCVTNLVGTVTVAVDGPILDGGHDYPLSKSGDGVLSLAGDNSGYGGAISVMSNSVLRVAHRYGLGGSSAPVVVNYGGTLQVGGGATVERAVVLNGGPGVEVCALMSAEGTNLWRGAITQAQPSYIGAAAGGTLVLAAHPATGNLLLAPAEGGCVLIGDKPLLMGTREVHALGAGTVAIGIGGNTWGTLLIAGSGSVRTDAANVLPANTVVSFGTAGALDGTLDLNGYDQTVAQVKRGITTAGRRTVTSSTPAVLTVNLSSSSITYDGTFEGAVTLRKSGGGSLIVNGGVSQTRGSVVVDGGTLELKSGSNFSHAHSVEVNGGRLWLRGNDSLPDGAALKLAATSAQVQLDGEGEDVVSTLWIGGVQMRRGTYGSSSSVATYKDSVRFSGSGTLRVLHGPQAVLMLR